MTGHSETRAFCTARAASLLARETEVLSRLPSEPRALAAARLDLAGLMLDLASCYIVENSLFLFFHERINEDCLNEARKAFTKSLQYMEEVVTSWVDVPFSDLDTRLAALQGISAEERYGLVCRMGLALSLLQHAFGENNRWKWSFVDFEGRLAAITRNILDLRNLAANMDPRAGEYAATVFHVRMMKKLFMQAAARYRERYELSTQNSGDFRRAIDFLNALRRMYIALGERGEAEELKKTIDAWTAKFTQDARLRKQPPFGKN
ncbi:MAG: hypothetical protein LBC88_01090 [Spirochaetaceae bacterium]|jgi:hypothetical protein|nr:hypothetical protein [Spirochaetaceae bacterium]